MVIDRNRMKIKLKENERIDDLEFKGLKIIQSTDGFRFGIDSVLLSDFAKSIKTKAKVLDIGTGTGIISILLSKKINAEKIIGIEVQPEVAEMAKRSVELNDLDSKIEIINDNINNIENYFENNSLDAVVTNPPYQKNNTGLKSENLKHLISRHEIECTLEDIIKKSFKILKDKGEFYMVHRPERLVDIFYLMRKYKIEPKEIRYVYPKFGEKANLILIKGIKNANEFLKVYKPLIIYNSDGSYTNEVLKIYNKI
jgi:tRNA1Val (adenine37-N6)-methyltransferase